MRILFDNLVADAALSALHEDALYPLTNLRHYFLKKIFKSTAAADTLTFDFGTVQDVDSIYIGFTNAATISASLCDASHTLITTKIILAATLAQTFAVVPGVRYVDVAMNTGTAALLYVGNISIGEGYTMPDPLASWKKDLFDASNISESADGQYLVDKIQPRRVFDFDFKFKGLALYNEIQALLGAVEGPVWVDPFEEDHATVLPVYAAATPNFGNNRIEGGIYKFSLNVKEVR